jgi:hypothetical protein
MPAAQAAGCDKACLENIATAYREAYRNRDPSKAPFAKKVRFSENNVEMEFPDGTWDTVTQEVGTPLVLSDPKTGNVGIYTTVLQSKDVQTYLAVRLKAKNGRITEVEHIVSTRRNLSSPPTPIADIFSFQRDPDFTKTVAPAERMSREALAKHADGYFSTLEHNDGEIRGSFAPDATRNENGMRFNEIEAAFKTGRYRFNNRVRDRDCFLIDEERNVAMCRGFIDHKGVLDEYKLTDGTPQRSVFREPQTWSFIESFKIRNDRITAVEATFTAAPYFIRSPWTRKPDKVYDAIKAAGE